MLQWLNYKQRLIHARRELVGIAAAMAEIDGKQASDNTKSIANCLGRLADLLVAVIDSLPGKSVAEEKQQHGQSRRAT